MTRTGQDAIAYARSRVGANAMPAAGYCLAFVRECFAVGAYYPSAIDAARSADYPHPGDRNVPPAVPVYFRSPSQYDHVAFMGEPGEIITTWNDDVRRYVAASTDAAIDAVCRDFDATYAGWAEDVNEVHVYTAPGPTPPPTPTPIAGDEDDDMRLIRIVDDGRIIAVSTYQFDQVPNMDQYNALSRIWGAYVDVNVHEADRIHDRVNSNIDAAATNFGQYWPHA